MATPVTSDDRTAPTSGRFQFRILDLLVVTTLLALFSAAVAQASVVLFLLFLGGGLLSLIFVWKRVTVVRAMCGVGVIVVLIALLLPAIQSPRETTPRMSCGHNLKQIVLALHNYHDVYGTLPPAYIADGNGRPMHSWRVLILPFMEHKTLYDQYRFDEPWDGPNNSQLADNIRRVYTCPSQWRKGGKLQETNYVAIIGARTPWPGPKARSFAVFKDGTPNVILVVEVHHSGIHWMEPRDLHVSQMAPMVNPKHGQGMSSAHPGGAQVGMADGAIKFLPDDTPPEVLRELITIDDGKGKLPQ
jgi:hypothetical protein